MQSEYPFCGAQYRKSEPSKMKPALRTFAGVLAGVIGSYILIVMVELFSGVVHPFPDGFEGTKEEICRHVERYPAWVLALVVLMWGVATFVGAWIAGRVGGILASAIVGILVLAALIFNLSMLHYSMWFEVACLVAIPASLVGGVVRARRKAPGLEESRLASGPTSR